MRAWLVAGNAENPCPRRRKAQGESGNSATTTIRARIRTGSKPIPESRCMPMRGFKKDFAATTAAHFMDPRSFRTLDGHDCLKGNDLSFRRRQVYLRDGAFCQECLRKGRRNYVGWERGEMHHKQGGLYGRHDDLSNLEWSCKPCHQARHVRVRWKPQII